MLAGIFQGDGQLVAVIGLRRSVCRRAQQGIDIHLVQAIRQAGNPGQVFLVHLPPLTRRGIVNPHSITAGGIIHVPLAQMDDLVRIPPIQLDLFGSFFQGRLDQAGGEAHALGRKIHFCARPSQKLQGFPFHDRHSDLLQDFQRGGMDAVLLFFR